MNIPDLIKYLEGTTQQEARELAFFEVAHDLIDQYDRTTVLNSSLTVAYMSGIEDPIGDPPEFPLTFARLEVEWLEEVIIPELEKIKEGLR